MFRINLIASVQCLASLLLAISLFGSITKSYAIDPPGRGHSSIQMLGDQKPGRLPTKTIPAVVLPVADQSDRTATGIQNPVGTIAVTSTADDGPGSLRRALELASNGDTINIVAKGTIRLTSGELVVDKSVTIRGPGAAKLSVSGNHASRVFRVTPDTIVTISRLTIKDGDATSAYLGDSGGGIYSDHARLTVTNCVLSGNSALYGGGIYYDSSDAAATPLSLNNSTLSNNSAIYGGGIFNDGGGFNGEGVGTNLTLNNTIVANNSANGGGGGGIYNNGYLYGATLTLTNSAVSGNTSFFQGNSPRGTGGIDNDGEIGSATLVLNNSSVVGNSGSPGGIRSSGTSESTIATLNNSTVSDNFGGGIVSVVATLAVNSSTVRANWAGGIYNLYGTATINDSTVSENLEGYGGGIANRGGSVMVNNTTVNNNSGYEAGGIANFDNGATLAVNNSTVKGNSARQGGGGGIGNRCQNSGPEVNVTLSASTVSNNSGGLGGEIFNYGSFGCSATFKIINSTVSGNSRVTIYTSGVGDGSGLLVLSNSTVSNNANLPGAFLSAIQNIGIDGGSTTVEIANTILNAATPGFNIGSLDGTVISHGYNISSDSAGGYLNGPGDLINIDPMLGPLTNNGGPTQTHALLLNSPAIDAGDPNFNPNIFDPPMLYDQRGGPGFLRVFRGRIDIGAFESKHP